MKKIRLLMIFTLILCCLSVLCACNDDISTLSAPTDLEVELDTLTLTWGKVEGSRLYTISIVTALFMLPHLFLYSASLE